jgi:hypothetical protein
MADRVLPMGKRYSVTIMCNNGAELESFVHAVNLVDALASEHIARALERIPTGIRSCAILVFEVEKK